MIKQKINVVIVTMVAVFCLMAASAFASAPAPSVAYDATVNVPNTADSTSYASSVSVGDIVVSYPSPTDLVPGGKITISAPADMAFVAGTGTINPSSDNALTVGSGNSNNAVGVTSSSTVNFGAGYFNSTRTKMTIYVGNAATSSISNSTVKISGLKIGALKPTKTSINNSGLHLTIAVNDGTSDASSGTFGTINLVKVPKIVKAVQISDTAVDIYFNTDVAAASSAKTPFKGLQFGNATSTAVFKTDASYGAAAGTAALDYNSTTNSDGSKSLVHVTDITPNKINAGDVIVLASSSNGDFVNALTPGEEGVDQGQGYVNGKKGNAVYLQPIGAELTSVTLTDHSLVYGTSGTANTIHATIVGSANAKVYLRLKTSDGLAKSSINADTGLAGSSTDGTFATSGTGNGLVLPSTGTAHITITIAGSSALNTIAKINHETSGIILEGSLDNFAVDTPVAATDTITIDRKSPSVVLSSGKAIDSTTVQVTMDEPITNSSAVTTTNWTVTPSTGSVSISYVELSDDGLTVTLHTSLIPAGTATIKPGPGIKDLSGNGASTTATNAFNVAGQALTSVSLGSFNATSASSTFVTKAKNGAVMNVTVEGPTNLGSSIKVRAVDASDLTYVLGAATTGTFTESSTGVYKSAGATTRVTLTSSIPSSVTEIVLQASTDDFVTHVESDPIVVDNTRPVISSASASGSTGVNVVFSEAISKAQVEKAGAWSVTPASGPALTVSSATLQPDGKTVRLVVSAQTEGTSYTVNYNYLNGKGAYDAADNAMLDNNSLTIDEAKFTGMAADTDAPVFADPVVSSDLTTVTLTITDQPETDPSGVDLANSQITGFFKDGVQVSGTSTKESPNTLIFTPTAPLEADATYQITVRAQDYAGNQNLDTLEFTTQSVYSATPSTLSIAIGATGDVALSGGTAPYTAVSSDDAVATVAVTDSTATVTGVAAGTATVTMTDNAGNTVDVAVTVVTVAPTPVPTEPTATELTGDAIANAPVNLGDVVTGGNSMQLALNFPAYANAVDVYTALQLPDGTLYFVKSDNTLTTEMVPYATGTTDATNVTVFNAFNVHNPFGVATVPTGTWTVYSLVAPTNGGDIIGIDWAAGAYDLQYYSFDVN